MLRKILAGRDSLEKIQSISQIAVNTLFDSELEKRFVEAIQQASTGERPIDIHKQLVNGKEGYLLKIGDCVWEIELQVPCTTDKGFAVASKPDFVLRPKHVGHTQKPVAVFTDGFQYHRAKIAEDTRKRMAIRATGDYRVWSLSWKDIDSALAEKQHQSDVLHAAKMPSASTYRGLVKSAGMAAFDFQHLSSFELLLNYLGDHGEPEKNFAQQASMLITAMLEPKKIASQADWDIWQRDFEPQPKWYGETEIVFGQAAFGTWRPNDHLKMMAALPKAAVQNKDMAAGRIALRFDDTTDEKTAPAFEQAWQDLLDASNVMQFVQNSTIITETGLKNDIYDVIIDSLEPAETASTEEADDENSEWKSIIEDQIFDAVVQSLARQLAAAAAPVPSVIGYELTDEAGACIAEAELAWEDMKIAVLTEEQEECRDAFEAAGWKVFACDDMAVLAAVRGE